MCLEKSTPGVVHAEFEDLDTTILIYLEVTKPGLVFSHILISKLHD